MGRRKRSRQEDLDDDLEDYERKWLNQNKKGLKHQRLVDDSDTMEESETFVANKPQAPSTLDDEAPATYVSVYNIGY